MCIHGKYNPLPVFSWQTFLYCTLIQELHSELIYKFCVYHTVNYNGTEIQVTHKMSTMPKLTSNQKLKVPLPSTPQRVQIDVTDLSLLPRWNTRVLQETLLVSNVQHVIINPLPGEEALFCEGTCRAGIIAVALE